MSSVATFNDFESESQILAYQLGLPHIFLEGRDDVRLFKMYWFSHLIDSFEFVEANDLGAGAGCTAVRDAVLSSRSDNIPAFGFTDRDRLFRSKEWPLLFSVDDDAFLEGTTDEVCYTTLRWEIEAYLLEPELLRAWMRSHRDPPGGPVECAAALGDAIDECEHVVGTNRFFAAAHHCGTATKPQHFAGEAAIDLAAACDRALLDLRDGAETARTVGVLVDAALRAAPTSPEARLAWLLRYVDTKRLIDRLGRRFRADKDIR